MNISFDFITCISHSHIVSVMGVSVAFNEILVHMNTIIQQMENFLCSGENFTLIHWFDTNKDIRAEQ